MKNFDIAMLKRIPLRYPNDPEKQAEYAAEFVRMTEYLKTFSTENLKMIVAACSELLEEYPQA